MFINLEKGPFFYNNLGICIKIIEAFRYDTIGMLENLKVIIATGENIFKEIQILVEFQNYFIPSNILIVKIAPQNLILKKASLFITHSSMTSVNEAIDCAGKFYSNVENSSNFRSLI